MMLTNEACRGLLENLFGHKFPKVKVNRKHMLIHCHTFDLNNVEDVVKQVTSEYTVSNCVHPRYMVCLEFNDEAGFNAAAIALKMQFG